MTVAEATLMLGVNRSQVNQLILTGRLRATKTYRRICCLGGKHRNQPVWNIDEDSIREYQDHKRKTPKGSYHHYPDCRCNFCQRCGRRTHDANCQCITCTLKNSSEGLTHQIRTLVTQEQFDQLNKVSFDFLITRSELVRTAIELYLSELEEAGDAG